MSDNRDEPFTLTNPAPRPPRWRGRESENTRQQTLLEGMDCLPGQRDLFENDGEAARTHENQGSH
jgi:hypothetical protein